MKSTGFGTKPSEIYLGSESFALFPCTDSCGDISCEATRQSCSGLRLCIFRANDSNFCALN